MLTTKLLSLREAEAELRRITAGAATAVPDDIWLDECVALTPAEDISTLDNAINHRVLKADGGAEVDFDINKTPYLAEIHEAMDDPNIRVVAVKGPARSGKTVTAENYLLKVGMWGPSRNVLWFMHSEPDLKRYVYERVNFFFEAHEDVGAKIKRKNPAWNIKEIDGQIWEWAPANPSTTRARSASFIVGDEIDAMRPAIRDAIITLIRNRQREYGQTAKAFVCSHPDAGPQFGIDAILKTSDMRIRLWKCPCCETRFSPAVEAAELGVRRITWNMDTLYARAEEMEREAFIEHVQENVRLVCPNPDCREEFGDTERLYMDSEEGEAGWIGRGQTVDEDEKVVGDRKFSDTAGFVIHAFMAPYVTLSGLAKEWAEAKLSADETGATHLLKEVSVKSLGETFRGDEAAAKPRIWKEVRARLVDSGYRMGEIPDGVDFLTQEVDLQGNRYEISVIGYSRLRESWLIDRYAIKQRRVGELLMDLSPGERLADWDVLEDEAIHRTYPFAADKRFRMGIAKTVVDTGGVPGTTNNARIWASNLTGRAENPLPTWRLLLMQGDAHATGEIIRKARKITHDDAERELPFPVYERTVNVTEVKKIIANRMEIGHDQPSPGKMHLPVNVEDRHVRELCAETYTNGLWISRGRNETWDHWVASEVAFRLLSPENVKIDWINDPPSWARPIEVSPEKPRGDMSSVEPAFFARFRKVNRLQG